MNGSSELAEEEEEDDDDNSNEEDEATGLIRDCSSPCCRECIPVCLGVVIVRVGIAAIVPSAAEEKVNRLAEGEGTWTYRAEGGGREKPED